MKELDVWEVGRDGVVQIELASGGYLRLSREGQHPIFLKRDEWIEMFTVIAPFVVGASREAERDALKNTYST